MKSCSLTIQWNCQSVTIQMKATEQYFPVVLFIMLYKVVLSCETVDAILKCDCSNESYLVLTNFGAYLISRKFGLTVFREY